MIKETVGKELGDIYCLNCGATLSERCKCPHGKTGFRWISDRELKIKK